MDLRVSEYNIYEKCLVAIESVLNKRFPDDKSVFYDGGKYFTRSLEYYADKPIPHQEFEYQNHITDVLANAFNSNDKKETPIQQLSVEYSFGSCKEIEACQLVTVIAEFAAIYGNKNKNIDKSYGSPGGYDGEVIETMEDLFLLALLKIISTSDTDWVRTRILILRFRSLRRLSTICSLPNEANSSRQNRIVCLFSGGLDEKYSIDCAVIIRSRSP